MRKLMTILYAITNLPLIAVILLMRFGEMEGDFGKLEQNMEDMWERTEIGICGWSKQQSRMEDAKEQQEGWRTEWPDAGQKDGRKISCWRVNAVPGGRIRIPISEDDRKEISSISFCGKWEGNGEERKWVTVVRIVRKIG